MSEKTQPTAIKSPVIKSDVWGEAKKLPVPGYFFEGLVTLLNVNAEAEFERDRFVEARLVGGRVMVLHENLFNEAPAIKWVVSDFLTGGRVKAHRFQKGA